MLAQVVSQNCAQGRVCAVALRARHVAILARADVDIVPAEAIHAKVGIIGQCVGVLRECNSLRAKRAVLPLAVRALDGKHVVLVQRFVRRIESVELIAAIRLLGVHRIADFVAVGTDSWIAVIFAAHPAVRVCRDVVGTSAVVFRIPDKARVMRERFNSAVHAVRGHGRGEIGEDGLVARGTRAWLVHRIDRAVAGAATDALQVFAFKRCAAGICTHRAARPALGAVAAQAHLASERRVLIGNRKSRVEDRITRGLTHHAGGPKAVGLSMLVVVRVAVAANLSRHERLDERVGLRTTVKEVAERCRHRRGDGERYANGSSGDQSNIEGFGRGPLE